MVASNGSATRIPDLPTGIGDFRFAFFLELRGRPVCTGAGAGDGGGHDGDRLGKLSDLVFAVREPYPEAVGLYIDHGWGKPNEFIPWNRVLRIEKDGILVLPPDGGPHYPPFVDQPGWLLLGEHLLGRTILDMDGRRTEVVNDVHLLQSQRHLLLVHVDTSFNGFLRRWHLGGRRWIKDALISWKQVQPFSVEDAVKTDRLSLSVTRKQLKTLPPEDLADTLEELKGEEQEALFSALDSETAAETLLEAEPRAQRQLIATLRRERAAQILDQMSTHQLVNLLAILPHDHMEELLGLLRADEAARIRSILSEQEVQARSLLDASFLAFAAETKVAEVVKAVRRSGMEPHGISYCYVIEPGSRKLLGVVDVRELVLAADEATLGSIMTSPVVAAEEDDIQEDLAQIFEKYRYRMIPVVDADDRIRGVVHYNDIMRSAEVRAKE